MENNIIKCSNTELLVKSIFNSNIEKYGKDWLSGVCNTDIFFNPRINIHINTGTALDSLIYNNIFNYVNSIRNIYRDIVTLLAINIYTNNQSDNDLEEFTYETVIDILKTLLTNNVNAIKDLKNSDINLDQKDNINTLLTYTDELLIVENFENVLNNINTIFVGLELIYDINIDNIIEGLISYIEVKDVYIINTTEYLLPELCVIKDCSVDKIAIQVLDTITNITTPITTHSIVIENNNELNSGTYILIVNVDDLDIYKLTTYSFIEDIACVYNVYPIYIKK